MSLYRLGLLVSLWLLPARLLEYQVLYTRLRYEVAVGAPGFRGGGKELFLAC